jgi:hypothetical protein
MSTTVPRMSSQKTENLLAALFGKARRAVLALLYLILMTMSSKMGVSAA